MNISRKLFLFALVASGIAVLSCGCSSRKSTEELATLANTGDAKSCYEYGVRLLLGRDAARNHRAAFHWLLLAAEKGEIRAAAAIGACYANGLGTQPNSENARKWYRKAADAGHMHAQLELGEHYLNKSPKDAREAVTYIRYAAMQGSAEAAYRLSLCFAEGTGVPAHPALARGWLINAAELGHPRARTILGMPAITQLNTEIDLIL